MMTALSITEAQIFTALGGVLSQFGLASTSGAMPIPIVRGQVNRVPQPAQPDHVVMWPLLRTRLATNIDATTDAQFLGSIAANVLTVGHVVAGSPAIGQSLFGTGITPGCAILSQISGTPNGAGAYQVSPTANVAYGTIYNGTDAITQKTELTVQVDIHGPASADNAARVSTFWRSAFCVDLCQGTGGIIAPLYHSDPRQMPFDNAENQVEERWSIDLAMQVDPVVTVPQQFAGTLTVTPMPILALIQ